MSRRSKKRPLCEDEAALWQKVVKTVKPLDPDAISLPPTAPLLRETESPKPTRTKKPPTRVPSPPISARPRLNSGDPQKARRVSRGRMPIDATIDLHGMRQLEAETRLYRFLAGAKARQHRTVLVITGKGAPDGIYDPFAEAPRGILRRRFLEWIEIPPFTSLISSVQPAHIKHGGSGAFYVFLKATR